MTAAAELGGQRYALRRIFRKKAPSETLWTSRGALSPQNSHPQLGRGVRGRQWLGKVVSSSLFSQAVSGSTVPNLLAAGGDGVRAFAALLRPCASHGTDKLIDRVSTGEAQQPASIMPRAPPPPGARR